MRNLITEIQFTFRQNILGKIPFRKGSPHTYPLEERQGEYEFYRLALARIMAPHLAEKITDVFDIGCRNWSYLDCLADFFPHARLVGIEVDGGRRYWNLYRRIDLARAYAHEIQNKGREAQIFGKDFRQFIPSSTFGTALFCFFFPFVSENPCLKWGLPRSYADFSALLKHSLSISNGSPSQAFVLSAHQGEWELEEALLAYKKCGLRPEVKELKASEYAGFWPSSFDTQLLFVSL